MAERSATNDPRWHAVLDAMERAALQVEHIGADFDYEPCSVPEDLGPLPQSLRDRAVEVNAALESGIGVAGHRLGAIRTELARLEPARRTASAPDRRGAFEARA